jgi:hypothetical protein
LSQRASDACRVAAGYHRSVELPPHNLLNYHTPTRATGERRNLDPVAAFVAMVLCWPPATVAIRSILIDGPRPGRGIVGTDDGILVAFAIPLALGAAFVYARVRRTIALPLRLALATSAVGLAILTLIRAAMVW